MLIRLATKVFGSSNERTLRSLSRHVAPINALEPQYAAMSDEVLRGQTSLFRERLEKGEKLDSLLEEAFAVVREAARRTLGLRHFDVQMIGGVVLHGGRIAEMKTGEGKTLVATLPVYLNALGGKGVHVVTVNDYLARRDTEWMGRIYRFLGLSVGCILSNMNDSDRRAAYAADITYGTNNEFGFDYLRDNMKFRLEDMVQRPFHYAIVDEVDSILIDEARTPLIISGPSEGSTDLYAAVDRIIPELSADLYDLDEKVRTVNLNEDGIEQVEALLREHGLLKQGSMYDLQNIALVHHTNQALRAHKLFQRDRDYIVKDNKVVIIDEFTGRMMEGRRFSEGLHQALEAKEHVKIQNENQTLASITFQNYFRMYPKLAGMTGTALTEAAEFQEIYNLSVIEIPTNVPVTRIDHDDQIYKSFQEKEDAIVDIIRDCRERGQPVLVGTVSIEKSEKLAARLQKAKIPHHVLNARYHEQEAFIIAQAGRPGAVTIATNMAGRGTDIQLGGNPDMRIAQEIQPDWTEDRKADVAARIRAECARDKQTVLEAGGLYVIGTERHESRRIDNQLRGRSGRQGDPGTTIFFLSLEDDLMRIFGSDKMEALLANKHIGLRDGEPLTHRWISKALERAQARVEHQNFEIRKNLLKFDNVMNDQRKVIYDQRRDIMGADHVDALIADMRLEVVEDLVHRFIPPHAYAEQWDTKTLRAELGRLLGLDLPVEDWAKEEGIAETEILERIHDAADRKAAEKAATIGPQAFRQIEKSVLLQLLDQNWKEHLLNLDHLRQGINLRAFGQRDPLNEYKAEAFSLFEQMLGQLRETVTQMLSLLHIGATEDGRLGLFMPGARPDPAKLQETRRDPAMDAAPPSSGRTGSPPREAQPTIQRRFDPRDPKTWAGTPRNNPCPCGSGKKYKHCHGSIL
jgi:preprotein translocase subunit SecA